MTEPANSESAPWARILTIGDELLSGERLDGNSRWLARHLTKIGFRVRGMETVGDDEGVIALALLRGVEDSEFLLVTGGLGPTLDDRTRQAVTRAWGVRLEEDTGLIQELGSRFRARGFRDLPETNRRIALVPAGGRALHNGQGSAPGLWFHPSRVVDGAFMETERPPVVLLLPGVPSEMRHLVEEAAASQIERVFGQRLSAPVTRTFLTTGIPESELAGRIEARMAGDPAVDVQVAYRPSVRGVELSLTGVGPRPEEDLERSELLLGDILAPYRYDEDGTDLAEAVGRRLASRGWTVALAESCTGGEVLWRLTAVPGSSAWVQGGVVAYANETKRDVLGVREETLKAHGAVSEAVALEMAEGVRRRVPAHVAISVTGVAGPGGGSRDKPVGSVWFALDHGSGRRAEEVRFPGGRAEVRERAAQHVLHLLYRFLKEPPADADLPGGEPPPGSNPSPSAV